jgi:uncharacterized delta-60 repeat protein
MRRRSAVVTVTVVALALVAALAAPARAVPAGGLDPTFGAGGIVAVDLSDPAPKPPCLGSWVFRCGLPGEGALDTIGLPDGSVVVVTPFADTHLAVMRFTPTGQIDPTFGTAGFTAIGPSAGLTGIGAALDGEGRLLVSWTDDPNLTGAILRLTRLLPDGTIDASFGTAGTVSYPDTFHDVVVAPDGRVHLVSQRTIAAGTILFVEVVRLTVGGQIDLTYGTGGKATLAMPLTSPELWFVDQDLELEPGPDGTLVVLASASRYEGLNHRTRLVLGRLTGAGVPDPTLDAGGSVLPGIAFPTGPPALPELIELDPAGLVVLPDGKILVGGERTKIPFGSALNVVRFLPSGAPDPTFGFGGVAVVELVPGPVVRNPDFEHLVWLGTDPAGRIVLVGVNGDPTSGPASGRSHVVRLTATGAPDPAFGIGGRTTLPDDLARHSQVFTTTGTGDVIGGGSAPAPDRACGLAGATYPCPDLLLFALAG